ncbi:MAG: endoglucanase, partial [Clostridium sp.]|nr:endoglucanase [Clostridium sp.]
GRYEKNPAGKSTFYGMAYVEHPVYVDPGSNRWFGMQCWSMQRMMELYLETGDPKIQPLVKKWAEWAMSLVRFYEDGTFEIPSDQIWTGQPDTWTGSYTGNSGLHVEIENYGNDLGVAGSLANSLATYAAATRKHGTLDTNARDMAAELINRVWYNFYCEDGKGIVTEEARGDYSRIFEQEIYVPAGWSGTMANGDKIQPGIKFIDIRSKYKQDPDYAKVLAAYNAGEDPVMNYHRFWHEVDVAIGMGVLATYFPELRYQKPTGGGGPGGLLGDVNGDGSVDTLDLALLNRYILNSSIAIDKQAADMNGDGSVDTLDLALLKRYILKSKESI